MLLLILDVWSLLLSLKEIEGKKIVIWLGVSLCLILTKSYYLNQSSKGH